MELYTDGRAPCFRARPGSASVCACGDGRVRRVAGLSLQQKQRNIDHLHAAARLLLDTRSLLEVSSRSRVALGMKLSAFNLMLRKNDAPRVLCVECAFQGSKVFEQGGPFRDLYSATAGDAKRDARLQTSGALKAFDFEGQQWPLEPRTAFYDWIYLSALREQPQLADGLNRYGGFTDIEFNPSKSVNCQARSVALFCALQRMNQLAGVMNSPADFLEHMRASNHVSSSVLPSQGELF